MFQVFVYGTLKPGETNYGHCAGRAIAQQTAIARGQLFALPIGYPAMGKGHGIVHGFVLGFRDPAILISLDTLEGFDPQRHPSNNEYQRQEIPIFTPSHRSLGKAWAYLMLRDKIQGLGGKPIPHGYWQGP